MLTITGQLLEKKSEPKRKSIVICDNEGNKLYIQVRKVNYSKLVGIEPRETVEVKYKSEMSEKKTKNGLNRFNNLILNEIKKL